ncbi:hypothetical protein Tco_0640061 [Tanacetum coccineum]
MTVSTVYFSQLEAHGAEVSTEDANHKVFEQEIQVLALLLLLQPMLLKEVLAVYLVMKFVRDGHRMANSMIAIRKKRVYKKTGRRVRVDGKKRRWFLTKRSLRSRETHSSTSRSQSWEVKRRTDGSCWRMDEGIDQLGERHTEAEETKHALMAIISNKSQAVKKLEAQLVTSQKQQLSLNEKLAFQANEIHEKDEKLKR